MRISIPAWVMRLGKVSAKQGASVFIEVPLAHLEETLRKVKSHGIIAVNGITGRDSGSYIDIIYHFIHSGTVISIKTRANRKVPVVPTATGIFPSAILFERECRELLGIRFDGLPEMEPVLLCKDSPAAPLRKREVNNGK